MNKNILNHFREFGTYTFPGCYELYLKNSLPDDVRELGLLIRKNVIHRTTLAKGNTGTNADLRFGDMTTIPWWQQPEDDMLVTAAAMLAELFRKDDRGFVSDREAKNKLVVTCRFVSILMASILKCKGIPARVRSGHASYFDMGALGNVSMDHWINQYWSEDEERWITIDVDGSLSLNATFDPYDVPDGLFDYPADSWLAIRSGSVDPNRFYNAGGVRGAIVVAWSLFYDFHSLMNSEIIYMHSTKYGNPNRFKNLHSDELEKIDGLARLMQHPDEHFDELLQTWNTDKDFRLLAGSLL